MSLLRSPAINKILNRASARYSLVNRAPVKSSFHSNHRLFCSSSVQMKSSDWSANQYLKFGDERTRAVRDLLSQVPLESPQRIIDLGCGPGNSTAVLAARYPQAHLTGMDSSPDMLAKARATLPNVEFTLEDLMTYTPEEPADLLFSNAVFQWLSFADRIRVIKQLHQSQSAGGIFAFQVPDNVLEPSHVAMQETANEGPWGATLKDLHPAREPFQSAQELYDQLQPLCSNINIWHTHYHYVLKDHAAIVEWVKGTGLRPFIDPLSPEEKTGFVKAYLERLKQVYPSSQDGKVLLRYPRLFVVLQRA